MAYTKHTWTTGEVITAGRLNNMEDGIADAGGVMVIGGVTLVGGELTGTFNKTWQEIYNELAAGVSVALVIEDSSVPAVSRESIIMAYVQNGKYIVTLRGREESPQTDSASGYPSFSGIA